MPTRAWVAAAEAYALAKREPDEKAEKLETARQALLALATHPKESGPGITVTRYWKQGSVDYKQVLQLKGLDLEAFRTKAKQEVRVTVSEGVQNFV